MAKSVSWGKEYAELPLGCSLVALVCCGAFAVAMLQPPQPNPDASRVFAVLGGVAAIVLAARLWLVTRTRYKLIVKDDGFVLTDWRGRHQINDDEITDLALVERTFPGNNGTSTEREIRFAYNAGTSERILMFIQEIDGDGADVFGAGLQRVLDKLVSRSLERLESDAPLTGDGWRLERTKLFCVVSGSPRTVPLNQISAVDRIDNHICVWANKRSDPILRRAGITRGAAVLLGVLKELVGTHDRVRQSEHVHGRERSSETEDSHVTDESDHVPVAEGVDGPEQSDAQDAPSGTSEELGCLLFTRGGSGEQQKSSGVLSLFFIPLGFIWFLAGVIDTGDNRGVLGLVLGPAAILAGVIPYAARKRAEGPSFKCYENGVTSTQRGQTITLWYRDVEAFTYSGARPLVDGAYVSTAIELTFEPSSPNHKSIKYTGATQYTDEGIEKLRDHISGVIAGHMFLRLEAGEPVRWTSQFSFERGKLIVRRPTRPETGTGFASEIPLTEIERHELKDGVFYLYSKMAFGRALQENVSERNFFPGYFLLLLLTTSPKQVPHRRAEPPPPAEPEIDIDAL